MENIPVSIETLPVGDLVHTEDKIEWAVNRLQKHRSEGPSGMRAEHLKGWLAEAQKEEAAAAKVAATEGTKYQQQRGRQKYLEGQGERRRRREGRSCLWR